LLLLLLFIFLQKIAKETTRKLPCGTVA